MLSFTSAWSMFNLTEDTYSLEFCGIWKQKAPVHRVPQIVSLALFRVAQFRTCSHELVSLTLFSNWHYFLQCLTSVSDIMFSFLFFNSTSQIVFLFTTSHNVPKCSIQPHFQPILHVIYGTKQLKATPTPLGWDGHPYPIRIIF